jgi:hypothetical protein
MRSAVPSERMSGTAAIEMTKAPVGAVVMKGGFKKVEFPLFYQIRQRFDASCEADPAGAVRRAIAGYDCAARIKPGETVAVAVGSRGIQGIVGMVAALVESLKKMGLRPFVMPAMGSHGGATGEGQALVLEQLGITEASVGAPIRSCMDVVSLGGIPSGAEVFVARDAIEADHLVLINRVKMHTAFRGRAESGLCKMLTVGSGKHHGAINMHKYGLADSIIPAAEVVLSRVSCLFGIAILENAAEKTHTVRLVPPEEIVASDIAMLKQAAEMFPRIPIDDLDILLVDEMGKNISGAGMDPNVIGMWRREGGPRQPNYRTLVILDVTRESNGNALGIGLADLTTRRVIDLVDIKTTYANVLTTGLWGAGKLPIALENDRSVVKMALSRVQEPEKVRMVRITNTLHLGTFWATATLLPELKDRQGIDVDETPFTLQFSDEDRLQPFAVARH